MTLTQFMDDTCYASLHKVGRGGLDRLLLRPLELLAQYVREFGTSRSQLGLERDAPEGEVVHPVGAPMGEVGLDAALPDQRHDLKVVQGLVLLISVVGVRDVVGVKLTDEHAERVDVGRDGVSFARDELGGSPPSDNLAFNCSVKRTLRDLRSRWMMSTECKSPLSINSITSSISRGRIQLTPMNLVMYGLSSLVKSLISSINFCTSLAVLPAFEFFLMATSMPR
ncbi:hypothetical protein, variant [Aphanomyces invadans]|uniref:Uncharacterized protein n=1 Tax=Aphanomyces invadans TaxID=157072 RepID=A0A024UQS5_9STRA|nr:hypothetical protein, variant [Aphanomyces invadans]ETW07953.1 hypothetical protein, variant [Aphanomyces invadans]|eukprot:XP_008864046.1 hypothetical protein, variant [Aphanomyces invadans]